MPQIKELTPIKETPNDYAALELEIKKVFLREIYLPLIKEIGGGKTTLMNSQDALTDAIRSGRISFYRGQFTGRFSVAVSKELKRLGARWDRKQGSWKIPQSSLPLDIKNAIASSADRFARTAAAINDKLQKILPEKIAESVKLEKIFDTSLWKINEKFKDTVKGITVAPELTPERRAFIASEYTENMKYWIKDFTEKEIVKLRTDLQKSAFSGNRYESLVKTIQKSFDVSSNKAKFLARQETSLLMTNFKQVRYAEAGIEQYRWTCVAGSANHPVRPMHKKLDGKIFRWDDPPITNEKGQRNNPGQDYNCRCFAKPIVRF